MTKLSDLQKNILKRIMYGYIFTILFVAILIPVMYLENMAGHSAMFMTLLGSTFGTTIGLSYSDHKLKFKGWANFIRTFSSFIIVIALIFMLGVISESSSLLKTQGWLYIPLIIPLLTALMSNVILYNRIE